MLFHQIWFVLMIHIFLMKFLTIPYHSSCLKVLMIHCYQTQNLVKRKL
ncbi:unnamed protein product [Schistosoma curassoni]|uniref:Uncharacterized protein n=1 Tax=Schistosoma curassoni TaxID=6186 RepID=A0A183JQ78_9TREM|nr:unnamed protein product [Schistosoma curassoni]